METQRLMISHMDGCHGFGHGATSYQSHLRVKFTTMIKISATVFSLTGLGETGGMNFLYRDLNLSTSTTGSLISTGSCLTGMGISFSAKVTRQTP